MRPNDLPPHDALMVQAMAAEAALNQALAAREQGELGLALAYAQIAQAEAPISGLRTKAALLACFCHFRLGQYGPLRVLGEGLLGQVHDPAQRMALLRWLTVAAAHTGHFGLGQRCGAEAMTLAEAVGDDAAQTLVRQAMALCLARLGNPWGAEALLAEGLPQAESQPVAWPLLSLLQQLAEVAIDEHHLHPRSSGEPGGEALARAAAYARRAQAVAGRVGDTHFHGFIDGLVGEALLHQGQADQAWPLLERALCQAQGHGHLPLAWRLECALAEGQLLRQNPGLAHSRLEALLLEAGEALSPALQQRAHNGLAQACQAQGQPERAALHLAQAARLQAAQAARRGADLDAPAEAAPLSPA